MTLMIGRCCTLQVGFAKSTELNTKGTYVDSAVAYIEGQGYYILFVNNL